ncbi:MAG TPA: Eco57I restriction-modification methylase domain-containing protein [bacterium]|nr:Eco57I restriction-modification methylase domain-containing protein [bacterium]HQP99287.1 Eco57I restriction-modification methylase domain-containing protein [bacterium]
MRHLEQQEERRLALQARLDSMKTQAERNRLGQFATPFPLAGDILEYAKTTFPKGMPVRFLDPAIGTGSFYSAFLRVFGDITVQWAVGYEVDKHYSLPARELWNKYPLEIRMEDFIRAEPPTDESNKATLVICNPPYVRHHHMKGTEKERLHSLLSMRQGVSLSGLSGLYCYFLCLSKDWMARDATAGWLIPSEFMDVNYGTALKQFLLDRTTLLHIHRFSPEDIQFSDALVSSAVVWFRNATPPQDHHVRFTFGGSLLRPVIEQEYPVNVLRQIGKWTSLPRVHSQGSLGRSSWVIGDFFDVKRGIATGANEFFVLSSEEVLRRGIPQEFLIPILPSPRYLRSDLIDSNETGVPQIERQAFLFSSNLSEEQIRKEYPPVWRYLQEGREQGIPERYICRNRDPWYSQEKRAVAPFLCTYMGRSNRQRNSRPFRFILNRSRAIAGNVYLMLYPKSWVKRRMIEDPCLVEAVWCAFNTIPIESLLGKGRVYGGGLHKIEPKELLHAPAESIASLLHHHVEPRSVQMTLFDP